MKRLMIGKWFVYLASALLLALPGVIPVQAQEAAVSQPSIGQPLMREGDVAIRLMAALSLGTTQNEAEAENRLAAVGIMPKNGWIADYPVTPDILAELSTTVRSAAAAGTIPLATDVAVQRLDDTMAQAGLSVRSPAGGDTIPQLPATAEYPSATEISGYYYDAGPPVITYYAPPPDYYYLYGWVPFPFWCNGSWFPGYFILHDFHRHIYHGDRDRFVSNHFRGGRDQGAFRVDPIARMNGRTLGLNSVTPRAGFSREMINNLHGRPTPYNGTVVRPTGPTFRRGGSFNTYGNGYGYHGRPVSSRVYGAPRTVPQAALPPVGLRPGGVSIGMGRGGAALSWSGNRGVSSPVRSSGFGGMHYSGGGFGGRGHR